jgi:hypothetical protein
MMVFSLFPYQTVKIIADVALCGFLQQSAPMLQKGCDMLRRL